MNQIAIYSKNSTFVYMLIVFLVMTLLGIYVFVIYNGSIRALIGIIFFSIFSFYCIYRLLSKAPRIILRNDSILLGKNKKLQISWEQIKKVEFGTTGIDVKAILIFTEEKDFPIAYQQLDFSPKELYDLIRSMAFMDSQQRISFFAEQCRKFNKSELVS